MRPSSLFFHWCFWIGIGGCLIVSTEGETTQAPNLKTEPKQHLVTVIYENDLKEISFLCYGVKIQPNHFLTAASCFDKFKSSDTGRLSIKENTIRVASVQRPNGPRVSVVGILEHPKYTIMLPGRNATSERRYDLAMLRVAESLDNITTTALLPYSPPQHGQFFCHVTVFKNEVNPDSLVGLRGNVVPTKDCISDGREVEELRYLFCVQLKSNPEIKENFISGAPVTCYRYQNDSYTIDGVFSWGYDSNSKINNLLVTSFANELKWIKGNEDENFSLPGQTNPPPGPSTNSNPTSYKLTPDPGQSTSITDTTDIWFPESTYYYPEVDDDSAGISFPLSLPVLSFIAACVLAY